MSFPNLTGPDFIAFVVDDVEAASAFWRDVVGLEARGRQPTPSAGVHSAAPYPSRSEPRGRANLAQAVKGSWCGSP